jgi:hypothetical protein
VSQPLECLGALPRIVALFGAGEVPRLPTRPPARDDTVAKSLNPKINAHGLPPSFRRAPGPDGRSRTGLRARRNLTRLRDLAAPRPLTPFGPGDPASPRSHGALGDLSSHDHRPGPSPRSRARRDDAPDGVVSAPAAPGARSGRQALAENRETRTENRWPPGGEPRNSLSSDWTRGRDARSPGRREGSRGRDRAGPSSGP